MQTSLKTTICSIHNLDKLLRLINGEALKNFWDDIKSNVEINASLLIFGGKLLFIFCYRSFQETPNVKLNHSKNK